MHKYPIGIQTFSKLNCDISEAKEQISNRKYLDKYKASGKKLRALGITFSTVERRVEDLAFELVTT